jgi:hypothetical protein
MRIPSRESDAGPRLMRSVRCSEGHLTRDVTFCEHPGCDAQVCPEHETACPTCARVLCPRHGELDASGTMCERCWERTPDGDELAAEVAREAEAA